MRWVWAVRLGEGRRRRLELVISLRAGSRTCPSPGPRVIACAYSPSPFPAQSTARLREKMERTPQRPRRGKRDKENQSTRHVQAESPSPASRLRRRDAVPISPCHRRRTQPATRRRRQHLRRTFCAKTRFSGFAVGMHARSPRPQFIRAIAYRAR